METLGGGVVTRPANEPVLITAAARSYNDQLADRKRKYMIMMGLRFPCLILAGVFYQTWWLALTLVAISIPLPWMAVLIANDGPARKKEQVNRYTPDKTKIESGTHQIIEGS
ncbi:Protein of unknown function [Amycolatopsis xylanica]|uniref:DUF3099 domain-containing protein n=1 Tax=Amycolatopsis xylanica TaxID=589385 RepID=A0A1H3IV21_9PSEU|nr:DUF3099 domain-containing protein [Amycolatopsis xylanica]SDY31129.1 Protein of unknown function [Amycolatopsis xylanica]